MKLFQLRDTKEGKTLSETYPSKVAAKIVRRAQNAYDKEGKEILRLVIVPGPDHRKFKENQNEETSPHQH